VGGESPITETVGLGGFAQATAPGGHWFEPSTAQCIRFLEPAWPDTPAGRERKP
jgi:hypothetical protein